MRSVIFSCALVLSLGSLSGSWALNDPEERNPHRVLSHTGNHANTNSRTNKSEVADLFRAYANHPSNKDTLSPDELLRTFKSTEASQGCPAEMWAQLRASAKAIVAARVAQKKEEAAAGLLPSKPHHTSSKRNKGGGKNKEVLYS